MRALKVIILILLLLVALFLLIGLFLPKSAYTKHTMEIKAPASVVFAQVNQMQNWEAWSPWMELEPEMQIEYGEILEGEGASYSWISKQGNGKMTIREVSPYTYIMFDMEFVGQGKAYSDWKFEENEGITLVTWGLGMDSLSYPLSRYFGLFLGSMMKPSFERGLKNLKALVENLDNQPQGRTGDIMEKEIPDQYIISIKDSCTIEEFDEFFEHSYAVLMDFLQAQNLEMKAPVMGIWHVWNPEGHSVVEAAIPVDRLIQNSSESGLSSRVLKGGKMVYASHYGSSASSGMTYEALEGYLKEKGYVERGDVWEIYITHSYSEPDPSKWESQIVYPIK